MEWLALRGASRQERIEKEKAGADDDAGIGNIEVGIVVAEDVHFNEVDDGTVNDAIMHVAQRAAEDER